MTCRWAWNADSGDTGGLVEADWETLIWPKIDFLTQLGLEPWYLALQDALEPAILQGLNGTLFDGVSANPPRPAFYIPGWASQTPASACRWCPGLLCTHVVADHCRWEQCHTLLWLGLLRCHRLTGLQGQSNFILPQPTNAKTSSLCLC